MQMKISNNEAGFSMMEVIVVISIILIALTISVPWRSTVRRREYTKTTQKKMDTIEEALLNYYVDHDTLTARFPVRLTDLEAGGYINDDSGDNAYLYDDWKATFCYQTTVGAWGNDPCRLWSRGPNKVDDSGAGDDIIVNPGNPGNPGTWDVDPAKITEDRERRMKRELEVIELAAIQWNADSGGVHPIWPASVGVLYSKDYLTDGSYRTDEWGRNYARPIGAADGNFLSLGSDGVKNTGDDIPYP